MSYPESAARLKKIAAFCRRQAREQREAQGMGMAVLRHEGFPDLSYLTPTEIDAVAEHYEEMAE